jgi:nitrogen fixation-related uncharacterized protein
VQSGQYDDTCTPAIRVLLDEPRPPFQSLSESMPHVHRDH